MYYTSKWFFQAIWNYAVSKLDSKNFDDDVCFWDINVTNRPLCVPFSGGVDVVRFGHENIGSFLKTIKSSLLFTIKNIKKLNGITWEIALCAHTKRQPRVTLQRQVQRSSSIIKGQQLCSNNSISITLSCNLRAEHRGAQHPFFGIDLIKCQKRRHSCIFQRSGTTRSVLPPPTFYAQ